MLVPEVAIMLLPFDGCRVDQVRIL
jgi:hypothetical protein